MTDTDKIKCVRFCGHCGNTAPQVVIHLEEFASDYIIDNYGDEVPVLFSIQYIAKCQTCFRLSLYESADGPSRDDNELKDSYLFYKSKLMWPNVVRLDPSAIPQSVLSIYEEASKIKTIAPSAFVVQIRRALEAICIDQGVSGKKSLHLSLIELTKLGKIPPLLSEVTNIIKIIGNAGAHAFGPVIYQTHVNAIDDFFKVVLEYLYVAPNKLNKFKDEASKFKL